MIIPFTKAHGAGNDFLLTWAAEAPSRDLPEIAAAICDRHTGVGADGWYLVTPPQEGALGRVRLFNSDGSVAELSGNGTRCAAAFLIAEGKITPPEIAIATDAGNKHLSLVQREENRFQFVMNMGEAGIGQDKLRYELTVEGHLLDTTILNVGNPQCAVFVSDHLPDWRTLGARIECDPLFPQRTNVSFVKVVDEHTLDVRFYERGAGETMSSGTGSTGAAAAALARGLVGSPVTILTAAGPLELTVRESSLYLTGPAEISARGEYYLGQLSAVRLGDAGIATLR